MIIVWVIVSYKALGLNFDDGRMNICDLVKRRRPTRAASHQNGVICKRPCNGNLLDRVDEMELGLVFCSYRDGDGSIVEENWIGALLWASISIEIR